MKDEYEELAESLVAIMDDARHELNVSFGLGMSHAAAVLEYCNRLQSAVEYARLKLPSEFRIN